MKRILLTIIFYACVSAGAYACSSSSSSSGATTSDASTTDGTASNDSSTVNPDNCVQPGATGNEKGIGAYCTPGKSDCPNIPGVVLICSGDFNAPKNFVFCTMPCTHIPGECGSDSVCVKNDLGEGCSPISCAEKVDGGLDGATD